MEKKEALEKCRDHWLWMMETGSDCKLDYFLTQSIDPDDVPESECYCCEYDNQFEQSCTHCPLSGYAWDIEGVRCASGASIYKKWSRSKFREHRKHWATYMVEACNLALKDLDRG